MCLIILLREMGACISSGFVSSTNYWFLWVPSLSQWRSGGAFNYIEVIYFNFFSIHGHSAGVFEYIEVGMILGDH